MIDASKVDELLRLAGRRALLARELEQLDGEIQRLREEVEGPRALPPARQPEEPPAPAARKAKGEPQHHRPTMRDRIVVLLKRHPHGLRAREVAELLGLTTRQAANSLGNLHASKKVKRKTPGVYVAP